MRKIYLLEDDPVLSNAINNTLVSVGFVCKNFVDYRLFFDEIRHSKPDLILLDLNISLINGEEVLKYLKGNLSMHNIPIIILSGTVSETEAVTCLDIGADDFMTKPFGLLELVSRINAVLRRFGFTHNLVYDNIEIDFNSRTVEIEGEIIELTLKELNLLIYLIERINMIVTREELVNNFWHDNVSNSRSIDMHINALRKKVFSKTKLELVTVLKVGYKLKEKIGRKI